MGGSFQTEHEPFQLEPVAAVGHSHESTFPDPQAVPGLGPEVLVRTSHCRDDFRPSSFAMYIRHLIQQRQLKKNSFFTEIDGLRRDWVNGAVGSFILSFESMPRRYGNIILGNRTQGILLHVTQHGQAMAV